MCVSKKEKKIGPSMEYCCYFFRSFRERCMEFLNFYTTTEGQTKYSRLSSIIFKHSPGSRVEARRCSKTRNIIKSKPGLLSGNHSPRGITANYTENLKNLENILYISCCSDDASSSKVVPLGSQHSRQGRAVYPSMVLCLQSKRVGW